MSGPKHIGDMIGGGSGGNSLLSRLEATQAAYRKKVEAAALPGETFADTEARLRREEEAKRASLPAWQNIPATAPTSSPARSQNASTLRRPPESDRQQDFFVPSLYDMATKDNRSLMDVALFRLSKRDKRAGEIIRYELTDGYVEVSAGAHGMASIWDYDIVLMMVSHLTESMNLYKAGRGPMPGRVFIPHTSDIAKFCRRGDGGRQADEIEAALDRLLGTTIKSVRESPSRNGKRTVREVEAEGLIGPYRVVSRTDSGKVARVEIKAPDWIYREVTAGTKPDVLTVHPDYFLIEPGLGRFIYRLARRAAGKSSAKWSFKTIYERSGSAGTFKEFSRMIRRLIEANDLPEYTLKEEAGQSGPQLIIQRRADTPELDDPEEQGDEAEPGA
ncbi:replication initiator protein A [Salmonella enterica]|nr:replication initiator protein A [Salmonella enterica]